MAVAISVALLIVGWVSTTCSASRRSATTIRHCARGRLRRFWWRSPMLFTWLFSGRGAYMQMGALIGTIMVANVFLIIIPNQKVVVADLIAGRQPDPKLGDVAKQRSLHNNYLTLAGAVRDDQQPLSADLRQPLELADLGARADRRRGHPALLQHAPRRACPIPGGPGAWRRRHAADRLAQQREPARRGRATQGAAPTRATVDVAEVAKRSCCRRCSMCHAAEPLWEGMAAPPKGVMLDTAGADPPARRPIHLQAVADPRHAARQRHRDRARGASAAGGLVRCRRPAE